MMTRQFTSFDPPRRTLMGPGPSDVYPRVLAALSRPTIGHLDPAFSDMMEETKALLQYALRTGNPLTLPISAPGSAGMEACFVNLVEPGEEVIVCVNGVFGGRMSENVLRAGGVPVVVEDAWGMPVDPQRLEDALRAHPSARLVAFVQAETSHRRRGHRGRRLRAGSRCLGGRRDLHRHPKVPVGTARSLPGQLRPSRR
jgi:alanine-glyoxylate transaminase/serine-glyoxylate transaminase/serine-pyruvate transaminase